MIGINAIGFYKNGGIHIKKENRGKFTDYCGGKVTDECIQRGKNSKDPKIRKRATFAQNSRRWKHEEGSKIHKPFGHRSILDNGWRTTKQLKDKKIPIGGNGIPGITPLPYGTTFRFIKSLENPGDQGIKNGKALLHNKTTAGYGTDIRFQSPQLVKKIKSGQWTAKEARDQAVTDMRNNDQALMKQITKYTNRPDTISHGPRLLMAQARYQYGNLAKSFPEWGKAVATGDGNKQKEIALKLAEKYPDRYEKIKGFNIYGL